MANGSCRYDPATGRGAIGVEFAGTGVTSTTSPFDGNDFRAAVNFSSIFVRDNIDLQWSEGFFRGFFTLEVSPKTLNATYHSMRDVSKYPDFMTGFSSSFSLLSSLALSLQLSATWTVSQVLVSSSRLGKTALLVRLLEGMSFPEH